MRRMQYRCSPIKINDQIQEIGLEFLGASKNLLIELYMNELKDIFNLRKYSNALNSLGCSSTRARVRDTR